MKTLTDIIYISLIAVSPFLILLALLYLFKDILDYRGRIEEKIRQEYFEYFTQRLKEIKQSQPKDYIKPRCMDNANSEVMKMCKLTGTEWSVIHTPFVGIFNDCIELYVKKENNTIIISDDGITFESLTLAGYSVVKCKNAINDILINYQLKLNNEEIISENKILTFEAILNFIAAIIKIIDYVTKCD